MSRWTLPYKAGVVMALAAFVIGITAASALGWGSGSETDQPPASTPKHKDKDKDKDKERYIPIPDKRELDLGKPLALKFARHYLPDEYDKAWAIFSRAGAYARFKDLLEHRRVIGQWYDFEQKATEEALKTWCEKNDIEVSG
jgi:hypothetical protein